VFDILCRDTLETPKITISVNQITRESCFCLASGQLLMSSGLVKGVLIAAGVLVLLLCIIG
jgi:hypothetical protein